MSRLNWDDARVFLALARAGTLSEAARELRAGVATVSRRIERMEQALGVPLFLRSQAGYALTDHGETMLPRAEAVEVAMLAMRREVDDHAQIRGLVRLACIGSLVTPFILPALAPLLRANPGLDVEILESARTVNLHRHDADLALRLVNPQRGHLRARRLAMMGFGLYGPGHGAPPPRIIAWPEGESRTVLGDWSRIFAQARPSSLTMNTIGGQVEAVGLGLGVALLPHFLAREAGLRLVEERLPDGARMERPVLLITHADLAASRRVSSVAEAVTQAILARRRELSGA